MSIFKYGNVVLPYARITGFDQQALYDDLSQTDWYLTKFDISCQAVLNQNFLGVIATDLVGVNTLSASDIMLAIRERLLTPKQQLSITFGGSELIPQQTSGRGTSVDAANGPKPQDCRIISLANNTFLVSYRIVACYWENNHPATGAIPSNTPPANTVLYNRWSETVDIDSCNYSTTTRSGKYIIASNNVAGVIADEVREQMAVLGVLPGFLRRSSRYKVSPDGLGIEYTVTDYEVFKQPPSPAFEATGYFQESASQYNTIRVLECQISLRGDKNTDQGNLVTIAIGVVSSKLQSRGAQLAGIQGSQLTSIPIGATLKIDMYKNEVSFMMQNQLTVDTALQKKGLAAFDKISTDTPLNNTNYTPAYTSRGTAGLLLHTAAYYDPNLASTLNTVTGQMTQGEEPGTL